MTGNKWPAIKDERKKNEATLPLDGYIFHCCYSVACVDVSE